jgi:hypothetical protein
MKQEATLTMRSLLAVGMLVAIAATARAQDVQSFEEIGTVLQPGARIAIKDPGGDTHRGNILTITPASIVLSEDGTTQTFARERVAEVRRSDRLWNGILIGAGAGYLAMEVWAYNLCGPRGHDTECSAIVTAVGMATFVPGGAVIGALVDKAVGNRLVYSRGRAFTASVSPVWTPRAWGVTTRVGF